MAIVFCARAVTGGTFAGSCMKAWKRRTLIALGVLGSLALAFYLSRNFWLRQARAYALGRIVVASEDYGRNLPAIDTVEVFTLDDASVDHTQGFLGVFFTPKGTRGHKTLIGQDAQTVSELWRHLRFGHEYAALCFSPVYGLQFKQGGQIIFQTSVCWDCSGYTLPVTPFGATGNGFDSHSPNALKLFEVLEQHVPLPKPQPEAKMPAEPAKTQ